MATRNGASLDAVREKMPVGQTAVLRQVNCRSRLSARGHLLEFAHLLGGACQRLRGCTELGFENLERDPRLPRYFSAR